MSTMQISATAPQSALKALFNRIAAIFARVDVVLDSRESYHQALARMNAKPARLAE